MSDLYGTKEERSYAFSMLKQNKLYDMLTKEQRSQFVDNLLYRIKYHINMDRKKQEIAYRLGNDLSASYTLGGAFCWADTPQGYDYWRTLSDTIKEQE